MDVDDSYYNRVSIAFKNWEDFGNNKPLYTRNDVLLSGVAKEWLKYITSSVVNVDLDSFYSLDYNSDGKITRDEVEKQLY